MEREQPTEETRLFGAAVRHWSACGSRNVCCTSSQNSAVQIVEIDFEDFPALRRDRIRLAFGREPTDTSRAASPDQKIDEGSAD